VSDDFDARDDTLARELRGLAPGEFELDADAALGSMRPALRRARARRRLTVTSTALGVFAVAVVGVAALRHDGPSKLNIQGRSRPVSTAPVKPPITVPPTTWPTVENPPATTPPYVPPTTQADHLRSGSGPTPTITTPAPTPTTSTSRGETTTTVAPPSTKTYSSVGGHATIRFAAGKLTLVSYAPTAGYTSDVRTNAPDEIEIRFSNGNGESRIRVRVQDGVLRPEITEH